MATLKPFIYTYEEINVGKYKTVKHYSLKTTSTKVPKLSERIKISKDQHFAKSTPSYWIELHDGKSL